jgi:hypothetical protein
MTDLRMALRQWVDRRGATGLNKPWVVFRESDSDRPKRAAWIEVEDPDVMGQLIIWESGECEVDLGSTSDPSKTLIRSLKLLTNEDLDRLLEEVIEFCAQPG